MGIWHGKKIFNAIFCQIPHSWATLSVKCPMVGPHWSPRGEWWGNTLIGALLNSSEYIHPHMVFIQQVYEWSIIPSNLAWNTATTIWGHKYCILAVECGILYIVDQLAHWQWSIELASMVATTTHPETQTHMHIGLGNNSISLRAMQYYDTQYWVSQLYWRYVPQYCLCNIIAFSV